jgi:methylmalonyl-CoA/ethylmalonyl-CoA epimerase
VADARPCLHHVVFCVERAHQDAAANFWKDLGFELVEINLADVGLRVLLDWGRGVEIISPSDVSAAEGARVQRFLDERGEGIYSVVVLTSDIDGPLSVAGRYGATSQLRQDRSGDGYALEEAMLSPVHGMSITFIATDLPA